MRLKYIDKAGQTISDLSDAATLPRAGERVQLRHMSNVTEYVVSHIVHQITAGGSVAGVVYDAIIMLT
jgi:hypothetical protein